jgi:hypothetical protein
MNFFPLVHHCRLYWHIEDYSLIMVIIFNQMNIFIFLFSILVVRPCCGQLYNLFHACDPNASRIEPLIQNEFSQIPPCRIPRYSQFPLGDGESTLLGKIIIQLCFFL